MIVLNKKRLIACRECNRVFGYERKRDIPDGCSHCSYNRKKYGIDWYIEFDDGGDL